MARVISLAGKDVGAGQPTFIVGEIGINHNGDIGIARRLIDAAAFSGCDAVKFQKRTPELSTPREQWDIERDTPWGRLKYIDYRHRVEFGIQEYEQIDEHCKNVGIAWFASCWDEPSVELISKFDVPAYKLASASLTDHGLLQRTAQEEVPLVLSTGMSDMVQIRAAVSVLPPDRTIVLHSTSTYPCPPDELNLRMIKTLEREFQLPVGYSGHEVGLQTTVAAVVLGACLVERHITLDRAMWGSDQSASVEPMGLFRLVRDIRTVERAMGDGIKRVYESELSQLQKLRRVR